MTALDLVSSIFGSCATGLPVFLVWLGGLVCAAVTWKRHPGISALAAAAFTVQIVNGIVFAALRGIVPTMIREKWELSVNQVAQAFMVLSLSQAFISAFAYTLLLFAIFKGRSGDKSPLSSPPPVG